MSDYKMMSDKRFYGLTIFILFVIVVLHLAYNTGKSEANENPLGTLKKIDSVRNGVMVYKLSFEGHTYIVGRMNGGGFHMLHAESCRCKGVK